MSSEKLPECLSNRNKALNDLVQDLLASRENTSNVSSSKSKPKHTKRDTPICKEPVEPLEKKACIKSVSPLKSTDGSSCKDDTTSTSSLISDFWRAMNDEANFKIPKIRSTVCLKACTGSVCKSKKQESPTPTQETSNRCNQPSNQDPKESPCCNQPSNQEPKQRPIDNQPSNQEPKKRPIENQPTNQEPKKCPSCCQPKKQELKKHDCGIKPNAPSQLRKALANLKDAAFFEKSCAERVSDLLSAQQNLTEQVQNLEEKEKNGVILLKKADDMWSSMEDQYKKQLEEKKETYKTLLKEKQEIDSDLQKWRKVVKEFDSKMKNADNCTREMTLKTIQKTNDIKVLNMHIESFKKRIASNAKELEAAKNSYTSKKEASEARLKNISEEMQKFQQKVCDECQCKESKEIEGSSYVKEARDDLQKICRCLLQKKLENEDLRAEKEALMQEIELLKATSDTCSERCARREQNILEELERIDKEISEYQVKCMKCHKYTDNAELTGYCIDCPRCVNKRDCLIKGEECFTDHTKDCVCKRVKDLFLDNVFENMYSVLEKQTKTCPGKEVADCVSTCLERSKNGKLDEDTRNILKEFILRTVKQNLNLTIIGGAVKTRCEMDPEMYKQLMLCLKDVTVTKPVQPVKADKATVPKKPPCSRWNETSECNCPKGPKNCPCVKKAPKPPDEPGTCGPLPEEDEMDSPDTRQPCSGPSCPSCLYMTNMRAAQCILGSEVLSNVRAHSKYHPTPPIIPSGSLTNKKATRITGNNAVKSCYTDVMSCEQSRHEMIEGVMGRYTDVPPIEEVHMADHHCEMSAASEEYSVCDCARVAA